MKKFYKLLPIMACTILLFAPSFVCAEEPSDPSPSPTAGTEEVSITLSESKVSLEIGKNTLVTATVSPSGKTITWSSSNEEVATVTSGRIEGIAVGTATITATVEGKAATVAVTVTEKEAELSSDATIKSLTLDNGSLNQSFKSDTLEYEATVLSSITSLKLNIELTDKNAGYKINNNAELKDGSTVQIIVTSSDGTVTQIYKINIVKDTVILNLKSLKLSGYALNETFNASTTKYTASIPYEIEVLTVQAAAEDEDAKVSVSGATNLKVGENTVRVTVTDGNGNNKVYEIVVTREEEATVEEKPTSIITSSSTSVINPTTDNTNNQSSGSGDDFLKYAIVSFACLILFAIGGIGIYFYVKTSPKKLKKAAVPEEKEESPIVEIETEAKNTSIEEAMEENLVETREFKREELALEDSDEIKESLFDDREDV